MRPVNLIPPESRHGDSAASRTGALPYVILGALVVAVGLVTVLTLTGNGVKDRESEIAILEQQEAAAAARAQALSPYAEFAALSQSRDATVTSLAQSRFDWERVLRELALVLPDDVWLTAATGTVSPSTGLQGVASVDGRDEVPGPALELVGCGTSMDAVAGFVAALRDIDGVTRVGIASSERNEPTEDTSIATDSAAPSGGTDDCRTRDFIAKFEIVAAFDAVPVPAAASEAPPAGAVPPSGDTAPSGETNSVAEQTGEAEAGAEVVTGVAR